MGRPIIQDIFELIDSGIDKIFPDKNAEMKLEVDKRRLKSELKLSLMENALKEKKLVFQDLKSAREMYIEELKSNKSGSKIAAFLREIFRPVTGFLLVAIVIYCRVIGPLFNLPVVELNTYDYGLIGTVIAFYFGLRHKEKETDKA